MIRIAVHTYSTNAKISKLPFSKAFDVWRRSLNPGRLQMLQKDLVELMIPDKSNPGITRHFNKVDIGHGNHINEVKLSLINGPAYPTRNVVFLHGYGAALGCFARNFQLINKLKDNKFNYNIHFIDNITCGLSSNPSIPNPRANDLFISQTPKIHMIGEGDGKVHNKYYKTPDQYSVDTGEFEKYRDHYAPILKDMEDFYTGALDSWRIAKGFDSLDYVVGHSFGGYWSASYALRNPDRIKNLVLLSPVGVERHVHAITNTTLESGPRKPSLSPISYDFLTRWPILSKSKELQWYYLLPFMPRLLKWLGPWGFTTYFNMWYSRLFKINKVVEKKGGPAAVFSGNNDAVYGTNKEVLLIIEYLFNAVSNGSHSDLYVKNLLTPATVSKYPLYDKFASFLEHRSLPFELDVVYGQYDFMNSEAGEALAEICGARMHRIDQGGHNLYIDNPFDTNELLREILTREKEKK